jgi:hypothetical protein
MVQKKATGRFRSEVRKDLFRIPISITKDMESWLQRLSNEMKASGGYKLPKSYILRSLLNAIMELKVDVSGVKTEEELERRFLEAIKNYKKG